MGLLAKIDKLSINNCAMNRALFQNDVSDLNPLSSTVRLAEHGIKEEWIRKIKIEYKERDVTIKATLICSSSSCIYFLASHAPNATYCVFEKFLAKSITDLKNIFATLDTTYILMNNTKITQPQHLLAL